MLLCQAGELTVVGGQRHRGVQQRAQQRARHPRLYVVEGVAEPAAQRAQKPRRAIAHRPVVLCAARLGAMR